MKPEERCLAYSTAGVLRVSPGECKSDSGKHCFQAGLKTQKRMRHFDGAIKGLVCAGAVDADAGLAGANQSPEIVADIGR
jgi:hypothetical protein